LALKNIANSLKGFAKEFFKFAEVMRKIAIKLGTQKRNASHSLPVIRHFLILWLFIN
jgi:hypothetical protein